MEDGRTYSRSGKKKNWNFVYKQLMRKQLC